MKIIIFFIVYILFFSNLIYCQSLHHNFGSRSKGMANANATMADEWSIFNNAAGLSAVEHGVVFFGFDHYPGIEGFDHVAAGVVQPIGFGNLGLSVYRFGDELYSEQVFSGAFSNKIGFVRLGLRANYFQMHIDEFGTAGSMFVDLGGIVEVMPEFIFGAYISNLTASVLNDAEKSALPVMMKVGFAYLPVPALSLHLDIHKEVDFDAKVKLGLEYLVGQSLFLRAGINTTPFNSFFGVGLNLDRFMIDYAAGSDQFLGYSHQATISFRYWKKDE